MVMCPSDHLFDRSRHQPGGAVRAQIGKTVLDLRSREHGCVRRWTALDLC